MRDTLAIMITMTTYGTWLRGDERGWIDDGILMPFDPVLENNDKIRMAHPPFVFAKDDLLKIGAWIGDSLIKRLKQRIFALTVQTWHVHLVVDGAQYPIEKIVKCAKDAVRWGLRLDRPLWTDGYDKRFCFDDPAAHARVRYVERHNEEAGLPAKPWPFIEPI